MANPFQAAGGKFVLAILARCKRSVKSMLIVPFKGTFLRRHRQITWESPVLDAPFWGRLTSLNNREGR
jgi:hypothetical protein